MQTQTMCTTNTITLHKRRPTNNKSINHISNILIGNFRFDTIPTHFQLKIIMHIFENWHHCNKLMQEIILQTDFR